MIEALLVCSLLLWIPLLLHQMLQRGFLVLIIWLFIAPVATNLIVGKGNPLIPPPPESGEEVEQPRLKPQGGRSNYFTSEATFRIGEILEPNRLLFGVFLLLFMGRSLLRNKRFLALDRTEFWMVLFTVILLPNVILFSFRFAFTARTATDAFVVPFLAYFVTRKLVTDEARFSQLTRLLAYFGCCLILLSLIEFALHPPPHRVQGPFRTRDYLYVAMMVIFFMVAIDALRQWLNRQPSILPRWVHIFVLTGSPVIIVLTLTRGNWVGFLAGLWVFAFLTRKLLTRRQKLATFGLGIGLLPIILLGALELAQTKLLSTRISNIRTIETRLATYARVLEAGIENPIFGIGLNNLRNYLHHTSVRDETLGTAHNSYLAIFAELGTFALIAYLAIMWSICRTGLCVFREQRDLKDRWRGAAVVAMFVAYLVPGLFTHLAYHSALMHMYLFVCAGAFAGRYGLPHRRAVRLPQQVKIKEPVSPHLITGK
jgi:O-antigen ligase